MILNSERRYYEEMWTYPVDKSTGCKSKHPAKSIEDLIYLVPKSGKNEIALDLGCGAGRHSKILIDKGYSVLGLDFAFNALKQQNLSSVRFIQGDACNLPLLSSSIDLVLDSGCLHHIHPKFYEDYASEVKRVLKPSGHLLLYQFQVRDGITEKWEGTHYTHYFTKEEIWNLFADLSFLKFSSRKGETGKNYWLVALRK